MHFNTAKERLTCRVAAVNAANAYANELYTKMVAIFTPLVGQKLEKVDGTLLEKFKKLLPELPCTPALHVYKYVSDYSLAWTVKTSEFMPPHSCMYHDVTVYVGEMQSGILKAITQPTVFRTDYTVEEIEKLREVHAKAKKAADDALTALYPFGEQDR